MNAPTLYSGYNIVRAADSEARVFPLTLPFHTSSCLPSQSKSSCRASHVTGTCTPRFAFTTGSYPSRNYEPNTCARSKILFYYKTYYPKTFFSLSSAPSACACVFTTKLIVPPGFEILRGLRVKLGRFRIDSFHSFTRCSIPSLMLIYYDLIFEFQYRYA